MTTHYPQFCALARALEMLGERWTLLVIRELLLGPKRFSDLRERLDGISTSVLSQRLTRLEQDGVLRRRYLEPPAASTVYELTENGLGLQEAVFALIRWGGRFLMPPRPGERFEPEWLRLALAALAQRSPTPEIAFELRVQDGRKEAVIYVAGGPGGTVILETPTSFQASIRADVLSILGLVRGRVDPQEAIRVGQIEAEGDVAALAVLPQLFETR